MEEKRNNQMIRFVDLFAGIGGMRIAFEKAGGQCVFSSEWDKFCQVTYEANFGEQPDGDIRTIPAYSIPDHDILLAGFPCQPFSIAGVSKKKSLGQEHGFNDIEQGNLFFEVARILEVKQPSAFLLENVKNLKSHDKGRTFKVISATLEQLGYRLFTKVVDAAHYVPQHRERIFLVGLKETRFPDLEFDFPTPPRTQVKIADILDEEVDSKYTISDHLWSYLQMYAEKHRKKGNGFGFGLVDPELDSITRTLSARYYKDGSEILIKQRGKNPRMLTARECARLMGFEDTFIIPVSRTQAYKQFGNSVAVPVVYDIAKELTTQVQAIAQTQAQESFYQLEMFSLLSRKMG